MSDDTRKTVSPDRDRINLTGDDDVQYWSRALDITADELRAAVNAVGSTTRAVRAYLGK